VARLGEGQGTLPRAHHRVRSAHAVVGPGRGEDHGPNRRRPLGLSAAVTRLGPLHPGAGSRLVGGSEAVAVVAAGDAVDTEGLTIAERVGPSRGPVVELDLVAHVEARVVPLEIAVPEQLGAHLVEFAHHRSRPSLDDPGEGTGLHELVAGRGLGGPDELGPVLDEDRVVLLFGEELAVGEEAVGTGHVVAQGIIRRPRKNSRAGW